MPTILIDPGKLQKVRYITPPSRKVEIIVDSTSPIDIYIVQASDIDDWKAGDDFGGSGFHRRKKLHLKIRIQKGFDDEWYLIFENTSNKTVGVHYEVYDL